MTKKVRSSRGEVVDFNLLKLKQQMNNTPVNPDVKARQDFIDRRLNRRLKNTKAPAPKVADSASGESVLPQTEQLSQEPKLIDDKSTPPPKTKQKTRPPVKKQEKSTDE